MIASFVTSFADLVFHVLAHVRPQRPLAASLHFPAYVSCCEELLGPPGERPLAQDALALRRVLVDHDSLASVQLLAWLFPTPNAAHAFDAQDLDSVPVRSSADATVLAFLRTLPREAVELLRCSVALEREHWEKLPKASTALPTALSRSLLQATTIAPHLARVRVRCVRALGPRGRAFESSILVGAVEDALESCCVSVEHATLQAAHEATVLEVRTQAQLPFVELEHTALTVLCLRARNTSWEGTHDRWLRSLRLDEFGGRGGLELDALGRRERGIALRLLRGGR